MKYRTGFVSNSSSSSFIIAVKQSKKCKECGRADPNFFDFVETISQGSYHNSDATQVHARTLEQVESYIKNNWFPDENESKEIAKLIRKLKKLETQENEVGIVSISYHDDMVKEEYEIQKHKKTITELQIKD